MKYKNKRVLSNTELGFFKEKNKKRKVFTLDDTYNPVADKSKLVALLNNIKKNQVEKIEISNDLSDAKKPHLIKVFKALSNNFSLKILNLNTMILEEEIIDELCNLLKSHHSIQSLSLSYCELSNKHIEKLSGVLIKHPSLVSLNLCSNNITADGAYFLTKMLESNGILTELNLSYNPDFGDESVNSLKKGIEKNSSLAKLNLRRCDISDVGLAQIIDSLKSNNTLTELDLRGNEIKSPKLFDDAVFKNRTVVFQDDFAPCFSTNDISSPPIAL